MPRIKTLKKPIFRLLIIVLTFLFENNAVNAQFLLPNFTNQDQISRMKDREVQKKQIQKEKENKN